MKTDLFAHEVTQTSAVFGRKSEVRVVFEGDGAHTDHQTIKLPALPLGVEIDEQSRKIIRGYADHEAGHLRHTDRAVLDKNEKEMRANPRLHKVWNALEDVWLERRVIAEYPGSLENIRETATAVDEACMRNYPEGHEAWANDKFVGPVAITWEGRRDYGHASGVKCLAQVSPELRANVKKWCKALDECETSWDVFALAKKIEKELSKPKPEPKPKEKEGKKELSKDGTGDKPVGKPVETMGEGTEQEDEGGDKEGGEEQRSERERTETHKDASSAEGEKHMEFDPKKVVEERIAKMVKEAPRGAYRPYSTAYDKVHTAKDEDGKHAPSESFGQAMRHHASEHPNRYQQRLAEVSGNINVVRRKLERSLMAKMNRAWTGGHLVGRLDPKRLVPAFNAEANVYKNREPAPELDTAVEILVDLSGSMRGGKVQLAANVCVVLSEVLRKSGIPFEVTGFSNTSTPVVMVDGKRVKKSVFDIQAENPGFDRYESLDLLVFKAFDDRFHDAKVHVANLDRFVGANNSDSEALLMVAPRLEARQERRKVLLVLSDGLPEFYGDTGRGARHLKQVVKDIGKRGIDCIGIGIHTDAVSEFYPRNVAVWRLEDLGKHAVDQLAKVLLGDKYVVDPSTLMKGAA